MAVFILVLLFSAGVLAQQHRPLAFRQDSGNKAFKWPPVALARPISVKEHQEDSAFASESGSDLRPNHRTLISEDQSSNDEVDDSGCAFPFVRVGNSCYLFSSEQLNFADAEDYCESLSHGNSYAVTLAMMDYDRYEDQALLDAVTEKSNTFWVGGTTEDGVSWSWLDNRTISLRAPFWEWREPNTPANKCAVAQVSSSGNNVRSYIYDGECNGPFNFICQNRFIFNFEFRLIGGDYYFLSEEVGLPHTHWQEARNYCQGLLVPLGYHADLAVLNMTQQDDYDLIYSLFSTDVSLTYWIGAVAENDDCNFDYIDGRPLPISSSYWFYSRPACGTHKFVGLYYEKGTDRASLWDWPEGSSYPFICQMFAN